MSKSKKDKKREKFTSRQRPRKPSRKRRRTAAANALIDNKAFGITSQVEATVDATKDTASLNSVEVSPNENVNESSQEDILRASPSSSHTLNLALPAKHRVDHRMILRRNLRQIRNLNQPVSLKRLACQLQQVNLVQRAPALVSSLLTVPKAQ